MVGGTSRETTLSSRQSEMHGIPAFLQHLPEPLKRLLVHGKSDVRCAPSTPNCTTKSDFEADFPSGNDPLACGSLHDAEGN